MITIDGCRTVHVLKSLTSVSCEGAVTCLLSKEAKTRVIPAVLNQWPDCCGYLKLPTCWKHWISHRTLVNYHVVHEVHNQHNGKVGYLSPLHTSSHRQPVIDLLLSPSLPLAIAVAFIRNPAHYVRAWLPVMWRPRLTATQSQLVLGKT